MSNKIEKEIFRLNPLKIVLHNNLENLLGTNYAQLQYKMEQTTVLVVVKLFKECKQDLKNKVEQLILKIGSAFCEALSVKVVFEVLNNERELPKYYYLLFYNKYLRYKTPPFATLNKLETLKLPPKVSGLYIKIRGKRGQRKDQKTLILGDVSKHSLIPGKLKKYKGILHTPMGVMGVTTTLMMK